MSAQEDLTVALWGKRFSGDADETAAMVLDALKAAGYAVVKLPEPETRQLHDIDGGKAEYHEFTDGSDDGTVGAYPGKGVVYSATGWEWTPQQARDVGACWLAAAELASVVAS